MHSRLALASLALALLLAPAAHAGQPATIGQGESPSIDVEPGNGTAHVVWTDPDKLTYCRVPRGAASCAVTKDLPGPAVTGFPDDAFIIRTSATNLIIAMPIYATDKSYTWSSGNNGDTWTGPNKVYDAVSQLPDASRPVFLPSTGLVFASDGGIVWRSGGTSDAAQTAHANLGGGGDFQVVPGTGTQLLGVGSGGIWRTAGGDPRVQGSWTGPTALPAGIEDTRLASGPSGTYLFGTGPDRQEIHAWNGTAFGGPVVLDTQTGYINDVTVGPSGAVAAIWRTNEPSGGNRLKLGFSVDGAAPYGVSTIAREDTVMAGMRIGLAGDNGGYAVYEGPSAGATSPIRLSDLTPIPEPQPPAPPTPPTPPGPPAKVAATIKGLSIKTSPAKKKNVKVRVKGRISVPAGKPCSGSVKVTIRRKGAKKALVTRTLKVNGKCGFSATVKVSRKKAGKKLRTSLRYAGNDLVNAKSKTVTTKIKLKKK